MKIHEDEANNSILTKVEQEPSFIIQSHKAKETFISPFTAFSTIINMVLATGPFTIPKPFNDAGIILSTFFFIGIMFLAFMTADFLIEVLAIANAIEEDSLVTNADSDNNEINLEKSKIFHLEKAIEVGSLASKFWGRKGAIIANLSIAIYLYGALCIKAVSSSQALSQGIAFIITGQTNGFSEWTVGLYYYCDVFFFIIVTFLALKNVQNTKIVQNFIAIMRYLTTFLMILGALIYIGKRGGVADTGKLNLFEYSNFSGIFGNVVFAFLCHHSLPGILKPIKPETSIKKVLLSGYLCGCIIMYLVAISAIFAFGDLTASCTNEYPCAISTLYNTNLLDLPFIGHVANFYLLFNIAPAPILTMTLRNNLMNVFASSKIPETNEIITKWTAFFVFLVLGPSFIVSIIAKDYLSSLLEITGGFCGVILMMILPCGLLIKARKESEKRFGKIKHFHLSLFQNLCWPWAVLFISVFFFGFSGYVNISKLI